MIESSYPLEKKIGIIGGGQLGKMMILDAKRLGCHVVTLDPSSDCPSASISDELIVAAYDDVEAMLQMAEKVDVITYEFEHIHVAGLKHLVALGHKVYPTPASLEIIQNKALQKKALSDSGLPIPLFTQVKTTEDILSAGKEYGYPMMLKACTGGYDGKGNAVVTMEDCAKIAYDSLGSGEIPLMIEAFVDYTMEISVLACRGMDGTTVVYPVAENVHVDSILDTTLVPAAVSEAIEAKAKTLASAVMDVFQGVGMFCVEMFLTKDGQVLINEVAPRPHNSGHYTIEGCLTSQFENHIRAITGLPLGDVSLRSPSVMRNILGDPDNQGLAIAEGVEDAYNMPQVKVHIYGKTMTKPKRKMGHITAIGPTLQDAKEQADKAYNFIRIKAK